MPSEALTNDWLEMAACHNKVIFGTLGAVYCSNLMKKTFLKITHNPDIDKNPRNHLYK